MIPPTSTTDITGNLVYDEQDQMDIDPDPKVRALILNNLIAQYRRPDLATLREHTANASDSHIVSGQTRPIEVTLPSALSPVLTIRDWGTGMSLQDLRDYSTFGRSSKRDTNELVGGYGLGSKCTLGLVSSYTVEAVKDGKANTAVIFRDEAGAPTRGLMEGGDTDEPDGVTVTVPITNATRFAEAIRDQHFFVGWAPGTILIDGKEPPLSVHNPERFTPMGTVGWRIKDLAMVAPDGYSYALIGPVLYRINWSEFPAEDQPDRDLRHRFLRNVVLKLDNGKVELTPSREDLIYTGITRRHILAKLEEITNLGAEDFKAQINDAVDIRAALKILSTSYNAGFGKADYTFHDEPITFFASELDKISGAQLTLSDSRYSDTDDGFRVFRDRPDYAAFEAHREHGFPSRLHDLISSEGILVVEAGGWDKKFNAHRRSRSANSFVKAMAMIESKKATAFKVAYTDLPLDVLDPFFVGAFAQVITADQYDSILADYRKESARRAAAGVVRTKAKPSSVRLASTYLRSVGSTKWSELDIEALPKEHIYVLLKASKSDQPETISDKIRSSLLIKGQSYLHRNLTDAFVRIVSTGKQVLGREVRVLLAGSSMRTDTYGDFLPHLMTPEKLIQKYLKKVNKSFDAADVAAYYDAQLNQHNWVRRMDAPTIDRIKDQEIREWARRVQENKFREKLDALTALRSLNHHGFEVKIPERPKGHVAPTSEGFPMIAYAANNYNSHRDIVDYINLVTSKA